MTAAELADKVMSKWGMPPDESVFRSMLEYAFQEGVIQGSSSTGIAMLKAIDARLAPQHGEKHADR
jgi:hypothetical protein